MNYRIQFISLLSLLCMLPLVVVGQTSVSAAFTPTTASAKQLIVRTPSVRVKAGRNWWNMAVEGGMTRTRDGRWYIQMPNGIQDLMVMNFVDGYSVGPSATWGHMFDERGRLELDETMRWATGSGSFLAKGALRYVWPIEMESYVEVHGGRHSADFDSDPYMPQQQSLMATGLFGWNHYKLYEQREVGMRGGFPLGPEVHVTAGFGYEQRLRMENSREHNLFGAHAQSNDPRIHQEGTASDLSLYDGPIDAELAKASVRVDYLHGKQLMVYDDMTMETNSPFPLFSLQIDMGINDLMQFLSLDLCVSQRILLSQLGVDQLRYKASVGGIMSHGTLGLADWHHFDASRFFWQRHQEVSYFALLDNYELSTSRSWMEAHVEWSSSRMFLSRLVCQSLFVEYIQCHTVKVPGARPHTELAYGWDLARLLRVGVDVGFDSWTCRGAAFTMSLNLQALQKLK